MFSKIRTSYRNAGIVLASSLPMLAMAQTDPFMDAVDGVEAKVITYGPALVALAAISVAFFVAIKYVKKITRAA